MIKPWSDQIISLQPAWGLGTCAGSPPRGAGLSGTCGATSNTLKAMSSVPPSPLQAVKVLLFYTLLPIVWQPPAVLNDFKSEWKGFMTSQSGGWRVSQKLACSLRILVETKYQSLHT